MSSEEGNLITVREAAQRLNISERTVWKYIQRSQLKTSKELSENRRLRVMVFESSLSDLLCRRSHEDSIEDFNEVQRSSNEDFNGVQRISPSSIPLEYHDMKTREWQEERDRLQSGLMMYRFKFEDLDRRIRLLPSPPEMMTEEIRKRNEITDQARKALAQAQEAINEKERIIQAKEEVINAEVDYREQLSYALHEQESRIIEKESMVEKLEAELQEERKRPWWKKLLRK
jgi:hypothetical protein